jgi:hypothetical protein
MEPLVPLVLTTWRGLRDRAARLWRERGDDRGLSTLELAIIALGLMAVAAILIAAITAAVRNRTADIK